MPTAEVCALIVAICTMLGTMIGFARGFFMLGEHSARLKGVEEDQQGNQKNLSAIFEKLNEINGRLFWHEGNAARHTPKPPNC